MPRSPSARRVFLFLALTGPLWLPPGSAAAQQRKVLKGREMPLADVPAEAAAGSIFVSPDGRRFAYVIAGDGGRLVHTDRKGEPLVFDRLVHGTPLFSPDGLHLAVAGKQGDNWYVVLDGRRGEPYGRVWDDSLRFSPDGSRLALVAGAGEQLFVAEVGKDPGRRYDAVADGSVVFSPDSKHLAYAARRGGRWVVVLDGEEGLSFDSVGRPVFSPDGAKLAYAATRGGKAFVFVGGAEGPAFDTVAPNSLVFSPDSRRLAYVADTAGRKHVVVDGKPQPTAYPWVFADSLVFSPDGRRLAFAARRDGRAVAVVDGKEGTPHDGIVPDSLRFSPDGRRFAYVAERVGGAAKETRHVVVDGAEGPGHPWVCGAPVFSPDSGHVAYLAQQPRAGGGWESFVVLDGVAGPPHPWVRGRLAVGVGGHHVLFMATARDDRFADADELPWDVGDPAAGGRLLLEPELTEPPQTDAEWREREAADDKPIRIILVEERIDSE